MSNIKIVIPDRKNKSPDEYLYELSAVNDISYKFFTLYPKPTCIYNWVKDISDPVDEYVTIREEWYKGITREAKNSRGFKEFPTLVTWLNAWYMCMIDLEEDIKSYILSDLYSMYLDGRVVNKDVQTFKNGINYIEQTVKNEIEYAKKMVTESKSSTLTRSLIESKKNIKNVIMFDNVLKFTDLIQLFDYINAKHLILLVYKNTSNSNTVFYCKTNPNVWYDSLIGNILKFTEGVTMNTNLYKFDRYNPWWYSTESITNHPILDIPDINTKAIELRCYILPNTTVIDTEMKYYTTLDESNKFILSRLSSLVICVNIRLTKTNRIVFEFTVNNDMYMDTIVDTIGKCMDMKPELREASSYDLNVVIDNPSIEYHLFKHYVLCNDLDLDIYLNDYRHSVSSVNAIGKYTHKLNNYIHGDDNCVKLIIYPRSANKSLDPLPVTIQNTKRNKLSITIFHCLPQSRDSSDGLDVENVKFRIIKLIDSYNQGKQSISTVYSQYISPDELSNVVIKPLKLTDLHPELFVMSEYVRACQYPPTFGTFIGDEGYDMEYEGDIYTCRENKQGYRYIGLKLNSTSSRTDEMGNEKYKYLPCCYIQDQINNPKSHAYKYLHGIEDSSVKKIYNKVLITNKVLEPGRYGLVNTPCFESFTNIYKVGVNIGRDSILSCLNVATGNRYDVEDFIRFIMKPNIINVGMQEMWKYRSRRNIIEHIELMCKYYVNPMFLVGYLEYLYNVSIFLFDRDGIVLPEYCRYYRKYYPERIVCIYVNQGTEFTAIDFPQYELILFSDKSIESKNVKISYVLNYNHKHFDKMISIIEKDILLIDRITPKAQYIDHSGHCTFIDMNNEILSVDDEYADTKEFKNRDVLGIPPLPIPLIKNPKLNPDNNTELINKYYRALQYINTLKEYTLFYFAKKMVENNTITGFSNYVNDFIEDFIEVVPIPSIKNVSIIDDSVLRFRPYMEHNTMLVDKSRYCTIQKIDKLQCTEFEKTHIKRFLMLHASRSTQHIYRTIYTQRYVDGYYNHVSTFSDDKGIVLQI